jgi:Cellulase (glycosyl hydrolase family 5)
MMRRLLCLALLPLAAAAKPVAIASSAPKSLVVDGSLVDWNPGQFSVSPQVFFGEGTTFTQTGVVKSNADHSARIYFAYRADALLMGALVTDDNLVVVRHGEQWRGDGLELLVHTATGLLHVGVNPTGDVHAFSRPKGVDATLEAHAVARVEAKGWQVELSVPFSTMGLKAPPAELSINVAMRDVDANEPPAHRVWSGQRHAQPASAGRLIFERPARPLASWPSCPTATAVKVTAPLRAEGRILKARTEEVRLRMLNFQGTTGNWQTFWTDFDVEQLRADLDVAQRLKANSIRIFVFDEPFGLESVRPQMLERLHVVVREAAARGMLSVVTFFPFKKEFRPEWDERMQRHLKQIVSTFVGDPAIAMWDLMNEPDHQWAIVDAGVSAGDVERWARLMTATVRSADPTHLVTVGLAGHFVTLNLGTESPEALPFVDVTSVHWYGEDAQWPEAVKVLGTIPRPVVLQEVGTTALYFTQADGAQRLESWCRGAQSARLSGVGVWELFDHPVGSIRHQPEKWLETSENDFGLVTSDGAPRLAAGVFCRCMAGAASLKIAPP